MQSVKTPRFNYIVFTLLIAVLTSGHVLIVDALGLRLVLQIVMIASLLTYIFTSVDKKIDRRGLIIIYIALAGLAGDVVMRQDVNDILGYCLLVSVCFTLLVITPESILAFIRKLNYINCFFAICSITALILSVYSESVFKGLFEKAPYYSTSFLSGISWPALLSHADTEQTMFGLLLPRISAHLQQASLLPAYFLLPLGISLAFSSQNKNSVTIIILLFCVLSTGGSVYVALIMCLFIYFIASYIPRVAFYILPFILLLISSSLLAYFFLDAYDLDVLRSMVRSFGAAFQDSVSEENALSQRLSSGVVRLALMGFQVIGFFESFPFPAESVLVKMTIGGNVFTNGLRGGVLGFVLTCAMYYSMFYALSHCLKDCRSDQKLKRLGLSLIYALVFQSFIYNDFGFSTYYGYMMFSIILVLSYAYLNSDSYQSEKSN